MKPFPVTNSTLSGIHLADLLIDTYGLSTETTCTIFRTGINDSYMVQDRQQKYVLRVYSFNWRSEIEIQEEMSLLDLLHTNGIPVSRPVAMRSGNYIQSINAPEGLRYAVLFTFVPGKKVRNLSDDQCFKIGQIMAKMHSVTINKSLKRIDYNTDSLLNVPYQYASKFFDESLETMVFIKQMNQLVSEQFAAADTSKFRSGIVHLDIWYDNMNITDESEISIFDFDFCGNGWLMLDITYFVMQLFQTDPDRAAYQRKRENFLRGYQEIYPISEAEMKLIPYAGFGIWIFYLGVQASRFDNWSNVFYTENYLIRFIDLIKNWLEFYHIPMPKSM